MKMIVRHRLVAEADLGHLQVADVEDGAHVATVEVVLTVEADLHHSEGGPVHLLDDVDVPVVGAVLEVVHHLV